MADTQPKKKTKPTLYQVFEVLADDHYGEMWIPRKRVEAHGAGAAIDAYAERAGDYVAVPVSNITKAQLVEEDPPPPKLVRRAPAAVTAAAVDNVTALPAREPEEQSEIEKLAQEAGVTETGPKGETTTTVRGDAS